MRGVLQCMLFDHSTNKQQVVSCTVQPPKQATGRSLCFSSFSFFARWNVQRAARTFHRVCIASIQRPAGVVLDVLGLLVHAKPPARGTGYLGTCTCTRITFCAITFCQYFSKNVWQRRRIDNSVGFRYFWQMCSFQTSTGTRLSHRVDENTGATAEDDELLLVFWRLAGGAVGPPTFPFRVKQGDVVSHVFIFWPPENLTPTFKFFLLLPGST